MLPAVPLENLEFYRRKVSELQTALNDEGIKNEAWGLLRSLIARVVLTPSADAPNGLAAELHGGLAQILQLASTQEERPSGQMSANKNFRLQVQA